MFQGFCTCSLHKYIQEKAEKKEEKKPEEKNEAFFGSGTLNFACPVAWRECVSWVLLPLKPTHWRWRLSFELLCDALPERWRPKRRKKRRKRKRKRARLCSFSREVSILDFWVSCKHLNSTNVIYVVGEGEDRKEGGEEGGKTRGHSEFRICFPMQSMICCRTQVKAEKEEKKEVWYVWFMQFYAIYIYLVFQLFDCIFGQGTNISTFYCEAPPAPKAFRKAVKLFPSRFECFFLRFCSAGGQVRRQEPGEICQSSPFSFIQLQLLR